MNNAQQSFTEMTSR